MKSKQAEPTVGRLNPEMVGHIGRSNYATADWFTTTPGQLTQGCWGKRLPLSCLWLVSSSVWARGKDVVM